MRINLMMGTDNAAFGPEYGSPEDDGTCQSEVARILRELAESVAAGYVPLKVNTAHVLMDANGNRVGVFDVFKH